MASTYGPVGAEGVAKARHANTAKIMIGNEEIGECINVSIQEDTGMDGVYIIGDARPQEHNHNRYSCSVNISRVTFKRGKLAKYGIGGDNILTLPPFKLHAYDKSDGGHTLFVVRDVSMGGRSLNLSANQRIASDMRGQGLAVVPIDGQGKPKALDDGSYSAANTGGPTQPIATLPTIPGMPVLG